jgi:hypothetical protein
LEAFCSEHNYTIEQICWEWPASKFEAFYSAYARRKIADELSLKRAFEVAAMWGNPNMDSEKDTELRTKIQNVVDESYSVAIQSLYETIEDTKESRDYDEDDPFWKAMERGIEKKYKE